MLRLVLLRHAKAVRSADYDDFDRPLEQRGREGAALVGDFIANEGIRPDIALVSSACRTRETWAIVSKHTGGGRAIFERGLYHASPQELLERIRDLPESVSSALVIGHNPGLALLATEVAASSKSAWRQAMQHKFPTAALAVIDFDVDSWRDVAAGRGQLVHFVYPRLLGLDE